MICVGICVCVYLPLGVRHWSSLNIHTASPVAWITSAFDRIFWANAYESEKECVSINRGSHTHTHMFTRTYLDRVWPIISSVGRDIETHFHERHLCIIVLMELHCHFVLSRCTLGYAAQGDLKRGTVIHVEWQQRPWAHTQTNLCKALTPPNLLYEFNVHPQNCVLPENLAVPQFQPFTHISFSVNSSL